jgi:MFS transporter, ACS family, tartrate transporter
MIPYFCGSIAMLAWGWFSDRTGERRFNLCAACLVATGGLALAGSTVGTPWVLVGFAVAAIGFYGSKGPFWSMPSMFLTGSASAAGIAWINSLGNLGGSLGPTIMGSLRDTTGGFAAGLYALMAFVLVSAAVAAIGLRIPRAGAERKPVAVPAE